MPVASGSSIEWLLGTELNLPAAEKGAYALVVDPDQQWAAGATPSLRHRVKNNLPGTPSFCPMTFRTEALRAFTVRNLAERTRAAVAERAARPARAFCCIPAAEGFQIELCHRRRASAA